MAGILSNTDPFALIQPSNPFTVSNICNVIFSSLSSRLSCVSQFLLMGVLPRIECLLYLYGLLMIYPSSDVEFIPFRKKEILANVAVLWTTGVIAHARTSRRTWATGFVWHSM